MAQRSSGLGLFVDLFFMISGFVMVYVYGDRLRTGKDILSFIWKRIARLYPLHLVVLALSIGVWVILLTRGTSSTAPSFDPQCIIQTALLVQEYFDCGSNFMFNGQTWSISVEMGLYILLPLLLVIARYSLVSLMIFVVAGSFAALWFLLPSGDWLSLPHFARGVISFTLGILVCEVRNYLPTRFARSLIPPSLSLLVVAEMIFGAPQLVTYLSLVVLFIFSVTADREGKVSTFISKLSPLGQLTYSMYIWHGLPILLFMNVLADKLFYGNWLILAFSAVFTYALTFALSYWGYFKIEVPARHTMVRWTRGVQLTGNMGTRPD